MKIETGSVEEYIDVLKGYMANESTEGKVLHNIIYVHRAEEPLNGKDLRSATSRDVSLHSGCVIVCSDGTEVLAETQEACGIDRQSDGGSFEGSEKYSELLLLLQTYAEEQGYVLLPGIAKPV